MQESETSEKITPRQLMELKLSVRVARIKNGPLNKAVEALLRGSGFYEANHPASLGHHHAYEWGLLQHTVEVCDYALAGSPDEASLDVVLAAALCHDVMKTRDYELKQFEPGQEIPTRSLWACGLPAGAQMRWVCSDYYRKIHHIHGSFELFSRHAYGHCVDPELVEAVGHAILAHHGPVAEWGSAIRPQTLEAQIVHNADYISAHFGATKDKPSWTKS